MSVDKSLIDVTKNLALSLFSETNELCLNRRSEILSVCVYRNYIPDRNKLHQALMEEIGKKVKTTTQISKQILEFTNFFIDQVIESRARLEKIYKDFQKSLEKAESEEVENV